MLPYQDESENIASIGHFDFNLSRMRGFLTNWECIFWNRRLGQGHFCLYWQVAGQHRMVDW